MPDVSILPDGVHLAPLPDETLLRALGRVGLRYRVGCKRGGCGICKVQLLLGEVSYERPIAMTVLSDDERAEGIYLRPGALPPTRNVTELKEGNQLRRINGFAYPHPAARSDRT